MFRFVFAKLFASGLKKRNVLVSTETLEFYFISDLKHDPPRRPREMRIINPRLGIMMLIRR